MPESDAIEYFRLADIAHRLYIRIENYPSMEKPKSISDVKTKEQLQADLDFLLEDMRKVFIRAEK